MLPLPPAHWRLKASALKMVRLLLDTFRLTN